MVAWGYKMDNARTSLNESAVFYTRRNSIKAFGGYDSDKFQAMECSEINLIKPANLKKYNRHRKELLGGYYSAVG